MLLLMKHAIPHPFMLYAHSDIFNSGAPGMFAKKPSSNNKVRLGELNRKTRSSQSFSELLGIFT